MERTIERSAKRTIIRDLEKQILTIKGDYAGSTFTIYCIRNLYNEKTYGVFLTKDRAMGMCKFYNEKEQTNVYYIVENTAFV